MLAPRVHLPETSRSAFGKQPVLATHNLANHELFTDAALIDLLDRFPRQHLYALTMGSDLTRPEDNRLALHDGVNGAELLRAVKNGRLWLNITRVDLADARFRELIDELYSQIVALVPGFKPLASQGTLLLSSANAIVYYHADAPGSALWHIRGKKRIWIYPTLTQRFMKREHLEDIFAGVRHEYLPYSPEFDREAQCFELQPGEWISWPHNAPHRVTNLDSVNVSLSTEYFTRQIRARERVYVANRFFRTRLGFDGLSTRENGPTAWIKTTTHRVLRKFGFDPLQYKRHEPALRVNADAPDGVVPLGGMRQEAIASM